MNKIKHFFIVFYLNNLFFGIYFSMNSQLYLSYHTDNYHSKTTSKLKNDESKKQEKIIQYIENKIKQLNLVISDLRFDKLSDDEEYWTNITDIIEQIIIEKLSEQNAFSWEDKVIIFNPKSFFIIKNVNQSNYDSKTNRFEIEAKIFNCAFKTYFILKQNDFSNNDIVNYFKHKIIAKGFIDLFVDDYYDEKYYSWKSKIIEKINFQKTIFLNDKEVEIDYQLLDIDWINLLNIKNNQISFGLLYDNSKVVISINTKYYLNNNKKIVIIKDLLAKFLEINEEYLEQFHPFELNKNKLLLKIFEYIKENIKFNDLPLEILLEDFSFKTKNDNKIVNPLKKQEIIYFYYKNFIVDDFKCHFINNYQNFDYKIIEDIIKKNCLLDISQITIPISNPSLEIKQIINQIYHQIQNFQILIGGYFYKIGDIYTWKNFFFKELIFNKFTNNYEKKIILNLNLVNDDYENQYDLNLHLSYKQFSLEEVKLVLNDIFQIAYNNHFDKIDDFLNCDELSICNETLESFKIKELKNLDLIIFNKWNKIIGERKIFLEDYNCIENKYFEIENINFDYYDVENEASDYVLNKYGLKIKKHLNNDKNKINGVLLTLKIKQNYIHLNSQFSHLKFNFILPITTNKNIMGKNNETNY